MANLKVITQIVASENEQPSPTSSSNESPPSSSIAESSDDYDTIPTTITRSASESCAFTVSSTLSISSTLGNRSMTTTTTTPGVKFAPLPEIAPRKRKSLQPLGVAARSQLMRQRRRGGGAGRGQGNGSSSVPVCGNNDDREEQRSRQAQFQARTNAQEVRHHCSNVDSNEGKEKLLLPTDGNDDRVIQAFGKLVKGAGITLWRRMSDVSKTTKEGGKAKTKDSRRKSNVALSPILIKTSSSTSSLPPRRALANVIPTPDIPQLDDSQPEREDKLGTTDEGGLLPGPQQVITPIRRPLPPLPEPVGEVPVSA